MGKKLQFDIICATRQACPEVKDFLYKMGFSSVDEVFDDPSADLRAVIEVKTGEQVQEIINKISNMPEKKIGRITVQTY